MRRISTLTLLTTAMTAAAALTARAHGRTDLPALAPLVPVLPVQRQPLLRDVLEDDADLLVSEQDAHDEHVLDVLESLVRRAS